MPKYSMSEVELATQDFREQFMKRHGYSEAEIQRSRSERLARERGDETALSEAENDAFSRLTGTRVHGRDKAPTRVFQRVSNHAPVLERSR